MVTRRPKAHIFVAGHTDEMLANVPSGVGIEAVDLRALTLAPRFASNEFAESRFLVSEEARRTGGADYVGFSSANYDRKFPWPPHLDSLPRLARHLQPGEGLGPALSSGWLVETEVWHPGMGAVLERLVHHFGLTVRPVRLPYCNTFVCHRDEWFSLLDGVESMLTAALDWYGTRPPYRYGCPKCGTISDTGHSRYTTDRHIAYLAERITMLHFASRSDIEFVTPTELQQRTSRVLRAHTRMHSMLNKRGIRVRSALPASSPTPRDGWDSIDCPEPDAQRVIRQG